MTPKTKDELSKKLHALHTWVKKKMVDEPQAVWILNRLARQLETEAVRIGSPIVFSKPAAITPETVKKYDGYKEVNNTPEVKKPGDFVYVDNGNVREGL